MSEGRCHLDRWFFIPNVYKQVIVTLTPSRFLVLIIQNTRGDNAGWRAWLDSLADCCSP